MPVWKKWGRGLSVPVLIAWIIFSIVFVGGIFLFAVLIAVAGSLTTALGWGERGFLMLLLAPPVTLLIILQVAHFVLHVI